MVQDEDEVMIVTANGIMIRLPVESISQIGRNTQGVRVINLGDGDRVIDMTQVVQEEEEIGEEEGVEGGEGSETLAGENGSEDQTESISGDGAESEEAVD